MKRGVSGVVVVLLSFQLLALQAPLLQDAMRRTSALVSLAKENV